MHNLSDLNARVAAVKLVLTDVDGVMTDGAIYITNEGEMKRFDIQDGLGISILRRSGIKVGWISKRPSLVTQRRAHELEVDFLSQERTGKVKAAEKILAEAGLTFDQVCFVGDDLVDLALLKRVRLAVAVDNAVPEVKDVAHYVTRASGGHGAVREIAEMILKGQNKWEAVLQRHLSES